VRKQAPPTSSLPVWRKVFGAAGVVGLPALLDAVAGRRFTPAELATAAQLQNAGYSLHAMARLLGRKRVTVREHLTGRRIPGRNAPRPDGFAAFSGYCQRRLTDDPHLSNQELLTELAGLGYPGSFRSLYRALDRHDLTSGCRPWGAWRRALRRGEQEVQPRAAIYLAALPGQLELRTSSGCTPVNAVAAVGSLRSWYMSQAVG
jgi:hypothetical protein